MPRMNMHSGVVMPLTESTAARSSAGMVCPSPKKKSGSPITNPSTVGLNTAARADMNFFSPVMKNAPTVNARMFMDSEYIAA